MRIDQREKNFVVFWQMRLAFETCGQTLIRSFSVVINVVQFNSLYRFNYHANDLLYYILLFSILIFRFIGNMPIMSWIAISISINKMLTYAVTNKETIVKELFLTIYVSSDTIYQFQLCRFDISCKTNIDGKKYFEKMFLFCWSSRKKNLLYYYLGQCLFEYNLYYWSVRNDGDIGNRWIRFNEIAGCKTKEREGERERKKKVR